MGWTSTDKPYGMSTSDFVKRLYSWDNDKAKTEVLECKIVKLHTAYLAVRATNKEIVLINHTPKDDLPTLMGRVQSRSGAEYLAEMLKGGPTRPDSEVWAGVCLLTYRSSDGFNISYKEMSEDSGPCESQCPESILKRLSPTTNEYALAWRKKCWERIETQRAKPRLRSGCLVKFEKPIRFTSGMQTDTVFVENAFRQRYRDPQRLMYLRIGRDYFKNHDYTVLKETANA